VERTFTQTNERGQQRTFDLAALAKS